MMNFQGNTVEGTDERDGTKYKFDLSELSLCGQYLHQPQLVANILASNVETPKVKNNGVVSIRRLNFNDSYFDMMAELEGWDDEDDDDRWEDDEDGWEDDEDDDWDLEEDEH
jgi:hypothetical protein